MQSTILGSCPQVRYQEVCLYYQICSYPFIVLLDWKQVRNFFFKPCNAYAHGSGCLAWLM